MSASKLPSANGSCSASPSTQLDPRLGAAPAKRCRGAGRASAALWSIPTTLQSARREQLGRDHPRARRDVQDALAAGRRDLVDERPAPARVLPEAERRRELVVAAGQLAEQLDRLALAGRGAAVLSLGADELIGWRSERLAERPPGRRTLQERGPMTDSIQPPVSSSRAPRAASARRPRGGSRASPAPRSCCVARREERLRRAGRRARRGARQLPRGRPARRATRPRAIREHDRASVTDASTCSSTTPAPRGARASPRAARRTCAARWRSTSTRRCASPRRCCRCCARARPARSSTSPRPQDGSRARGTGAYSASKFALAGWSDSLWAEERAHGVHVGLVLPGFIATEGFPQSELIAKAAHPAARLDARARGRGDLRGRPRTPSRTLRAAALRDRGGAACARAGARPARHRRRRRAVMTTTTGADLAERANAQRTARAADPARSLIAAGRSPAACAEPAGAG